MPHAGAQDARFFPQNKTQSTKRQSLPLRSSCMSGLLPWRRLPLLVRRLGSVRQWDIEARLQLTTNALDCRYLRETMRYSLACTVCVFVVMMVVVFDDCGVVCARCVCRRSGVFGGGGGGLKLPAARRAPHGGMRAHSRPPLSLSKSTLLTMNRCSLPCCLA